jgi:hypothetical protein
VSVEEVAIMAFKHTPKCFTLICGRRNGGFTTEFNWSMAAMPDNVLKKSVN